jgi:hypothetical protein
MNRPTIKEIHDVMKKAGMEVFETPYSVTLGGIRTKDKKSGKFNDFLFASMFTPGGGIMSVVIEGTVDAGHYYRMNPVNVHGTAIIQDGKQYMGVYRYENPKKNKKQHGHKGQEAFSQIKPMDYWRDDNRDPNIDREGDTHTENARTNGHDMGEVGAEVNRWSAGCWGSIAKNMELLYSMAELQIENGVGDTFSYAMLHENMF